LSDEGKKGTTVGKIPRWEAELWSYVSHGDGIHCPVYQSCHLRLQGEWCLSEHEEYYQLMNDFLDDSVGFLIQIGASIKVTAYKQTQSA